MQQDLTHIPRVMRRRTASGEITEQFFDAGQESPHGEGWVFHPDDLPDWTLPPPSLDPNVLPDDLGGQPTGPFEATEGADVAAMQPSLDSLTVDLEGAGTLTEDEVMAMLGSPASEAVVGKDGADAAEVPPVKAPTPTPRTPAKGSVVPIRKVRRR